MKQMHPIDVSRLINPSHSAPSLILEIGANEGDDTCKFLEAMPNCEIHCFECDPRAIAKWKVNIQNPRAHLHEVALSDAIGTHEFHQSDGRPPGRAWVNYGTHWDKSGSLLPNDKHTEHAPWMSFLPPVTVPITTLDAWAKNTLTNGVIIDFAWVDVQGAEAMVLRGAQDTIKRIRWWYAECDRRPNYKGQAKLQDLNDLLPGFQFIEEYADFNFLWKNSAL